MLIYVGVPLFREDTISGIHKAWEALPDLPLRGSQLSARRSRTAGYPAR